MLRKLDLFEHIGSTILTAVHLTGRALRVPQMELNTASVHALALVQDCTIVAVDSEYVGALLQADVQEVLNCLVVIAIEDVLIVPSTAGHTT